MQNIEGVIFDMDDTIALTQFVHKLAFDRVMSKFGILTAMITWWNNEYIGKGNVYIIENVIKEFNLENKLNGYTCKSLVNLWAFNYRWIIQRDGIKLVPGFMKFNSIIDSLGIKKIIATGGLRANSQVIIDKTGIGAFKIVSLEDITNPKPDPEIFLKAAAAIDVDPCQCLVFEDSVFGITGAKNAGMKIAALTTTHDKSVLAVANPDYIISDYHKFMNENR